MTTALARAHALIAAAEKATALRDRAHQSVVDKGLKCPANIANPCPICRPEIAAAHAKLGNNDAPDIARALVAAAELLHDIARHADIPGPAAAQIIRDAARDWLAQHEREG